MSEWKEQKLCEFANINPKESLRKGMVARKIGMENLIPFSKIPSGSSMEAYNGGMKFRNGDTLVARITPCLENGKTAYINCLEEEEIGFGSTEYIVLREKPNISYGEYLYYFSRAQFFREEAIASMTGSSGRQRVQIDFIQNASFLFPNLKEQKAIASVLSSLDDKIDLLNRQNKTLETMAETLFRQWFVEEEQDDWEYGRIGNLFLLVKGKNITKNSAVIGPYPVVAGGLEPSCYHNKYNTDKPVITVSASGANAGFVRLYHKNVWSSDSSYLDKRSFKFIYFAYALLKYNQNILFDIQVGSAQPHVYPKNIAEIELRLPPKQIMELYDKIVEDFFLKIKENEEQIQTLEKLRDTLLPKLISGEVRVRYNISDDEQLAD